MVAFPGVLPVTTPVVGPTDATAPLLEAQLPPPGVEASVVVKPVHTEAVPVIAVGLELTVTGVVM